MTLSLGEDYHIKPANILIGSSSEGKLSDFGLARKKITDPKKLGVKDYNHVRHLAPEVWLGAKYSEQSDIYAAGMTLYRLLNGDLYLPNVHNIPQSIVEGKYPNRNANRLFLTRPMKSILKKSLAVDPADRYPSAAAMRLDIEKLRTDVNWYEVAKPDGWEWTAVKTPRCFVVRLSGKAGIFEVTTSQGKSKKNLRRMNGYCCEKLDSKGATAFASRILQNFTLGKIASSKK